MGKELPYSEYVSPIATPLLKGKMLEQSLKLIRKAVAVEKALKSYKKSNYSNPPSSKSALNDWSKYVKRGVQEVTKTLRKCATSSASGSKNDAPGIVFFASDVYPIDIISHLPIFCEQKNTIYAYVGSKRNLGCALRSKRPASVVMVTPPISSHKDLLESFSPNISNKIEDVETSGNTKKQKRKRNENETSLKDAKAKCRGNQRYEDDNDEDIDNDDEEEEPLGEQDYVKIFNDYERLFRKASKNVKNYNPYF